MVLTIGIKSIAINKYHLEYPLMNERKILELAERAKANLITEEQWYEEHKYEYTQ